MPLSQVEGQAVADMDESKVRRIVREEIDNAMLHQVLPIVSEQLVEMEHRIKDALTPPEPVHVEPTPLRLVDRVPNMRHLSIEDEFWLMDQAEGQ